ncbi:hypothetical protein V8G54_016166 [Vigna mungo]|uniref:Reverse transcriptase Ty1/copia-type domain-containing protein n=1 Tax=Vigna mungo TaxID=3915 RepID=A0AAQ3NKM9_VIGMU
MRNGDYICGEALSELKTEIRNLAVLVDSENLANFDEAVRHPKWRITMKVEIDTIEKSQTWELTSLLKGMKKIGYKGDWAWLVDKRYAQQFGVDYNEVYAPVAKWDTIRSIIALAAQKN